MAFDSKTVEFNILPEGDSYDYKIIEMENFSTSPKGFSVILRSKMKTKDELLAWFHDFQEKNSIIFRVLQTYEENTFKLTFKRTYRCIHNTRPKKGTNASSQHLGCSAKLALSIKNPKMKRSKDKYLKTHPCEIYIRHTHNHTLNTPSEEFPSMPVSVILKENHIENNVDNNVKTENNDTEDIEDQEINRDNDKEKLEYLRIQMNDIFEDIMDRTRNNMTEYEEALEEFRKNYYSCKSDSSLIKALQTFGKYSSIV